MEWKKKISNLLYNRQMSRDQRSVNRLLFIHVIEFVFTLQGLSKVHIATSVVLLSTQKRNRA